MLTASRVRSKIPCLSTLISSLTKFAHPKTHFWQRVVLYTKCIPGLVFLSYLWLTR